ncbi:hypothetical protein BX600DRAFT_507677 [Xylariales sp. PMI_506]|nr:hypothetical protein BX600DRAFT_507677 [Xylariales sp. PMI_506]
MAGQYSYPPPPPPPPSAAPANGYSSYGQGQPYAHASSRGGGPSHGGRGRGYSQGANRADYGSPYGGYHQDYANQSAPAYGQSSDGYWGGNPAPHSSNTPLPQSNYHPNYAPAYANPHPSGYPPYPAATQRPAYTPAYSSPAPEYASQQWSDGGSPYSPYSNRGGRGGYSSDRGGHRGDAHSSSIRPGYDQSMSHSTQASSGYGQQYPPRTQQHPHQAYQPPSSYSNYPPAPAPAYSGHHPPSYSGGRGRGRDGFSGHSRGRPNHHNDRGGKFHHKPQKPQHDHSQAQKSDASSTKKKKRKTNTLGLTPADGEESDVASVDEEKQLEEILGADAPVIPEGQDLKEWLAERRARFPTAARVEAKKATEQTKRAEADEEQKSATKLDKDEEKAEKLRRQLAKVERKLEKRKREANDEGDEMRVDGSDSETSDSDDDKPETQSSRKQSSYLPPPPITRADPTAHCKYYSTGGVCGKKGKCRFVHDRNVREQALQEQAANGGKMTLKQRLLRNDKEQDDLAVIQSIVHLRSSGKLAQIRRASTNAPPVSTTRMVPISTPTRARSKSNAVRVPARNKHSRQKHPKWVPSQKTKLEKVPSKAQRNRYLSNPTPPSMKRRDSKIEPSSTRKTIISTAHTNISSIEPEYKVAARSKEQSRKRSFYANLRGFGNPELPVIRNPRHEANRKSVCR